MQIGKPIGFISSTNEFIPLNLHQPLYSVILAIGYYCGIHPFSSAKYINLIAFFLSSSFLGCYLYQATKKSTLTYLTLIVFSIAPNIIQIFTSAMSDPIYIFLTILNFILLFYSINQQKLFYSIIIGIICALAYLSRFIGITNIVWTATVFFLYYVFKERKGIHYLTYYLISCLITIITFALIFPSSPSGRQYQLSVHFWPLTKEYLQSATQTVISWFYFQETNLFSKNIFQQISLILPLFLIGLSIYLLYKSRRNIYKSNSLLSSLFILFYLSALFIAYIFSSVAPDIYGRTLSPIFPFILIILFSQLSLGNNSRILLLKKSGYILILISLISLSMPIDIDYLSYLHNEGLGYSSKYWQQNTLVHEIIEMPNNNILTNEPDVVLLFKDSYPKNINLYFKNIEKTTNGEYYFEGSDLEMYLQQNKPIIAIFNIYYKSQLERVFGEKAVDFDRDFKAHLAIQNKTIDGNLYFFIDD